MNQLTRCPTVLLKDDPVQKDEFDNSHQRVADALHGLISTEEGGKAIALIGPWGSGKSTVIKLLEKQLNNNDVKLCTFDAWSHQGDPLRRSFLERVLSVLGKAPLWLNLDEDRWIELLKRLRTGEKTAIHSPLKRISRWWIFLAVTILLGIIPFAHSSIGGPRYSEILFHIKDYPITFFRLGIAILMLLFIGILIASFKGDALLSVFHQGKSVDGETKTITLPDASSIEFQREFRDILKTALTEKQRQLVIVIDNLDRVNSDEALSIWATMKTFFDAPSEDMDEWFKRFWLIVPFAYEGVSKLWNPNTRNTATALEEEERQNLDEQGSAKKVNNVYPSSKQGLAEAFLDKTFPVRFNIPRPVLSNWHKYFITQMAIAFPKHETDENLRQEFNDIYSIFRYYLCSEKAPVPRDIKTFINDLGAIHRQWSHEIIPLKDQALYIALKRRGDSLRERLRRANLPDTVIKVYVSPKTSLLRNMSALYFNVQPDVANQVLLGPEITSSLPTGNHQKLTGMMRHPGFWQVCQIVIEEERQGWASKASPLAMASKALKGIAASTPSDKDSASCWKLICESMSQVYKWEKIDKAIGDGLKAAIDFRQEEEFLAHITKSMVNTPIRKQSSEKQKPQELPQELVDEIDWMTGAFVCIEAILRIENGENIIRNNFYVPGTAEEYVRVIMALSNHEKNSIKARNPKKFFIHDKAIKTEAVLNALIEVLSSDKSDERNLELLPETIGIIASIKTGHKWDAFLGQITGKVRDENGTNARKAAVALRIALSLSSQEAACSRILADPKHLTIIMNNFYNMRINNAEIKYLAPAAFAFLQFSPSVNLDDIDGETNQGLTELKKLLSGDAEEQEQFSKEFSELVLQYSGLKFLEELIDSYPQTAKFLNSVLSNISEEDQKIAVQKAVFEKDKLTKFTYLVNTKLENKEQDETRIE